MRNELSVSLERLRTDYVDLYMLHRDNLAVPVGEFVEALNEEVLGGRVRAFGASNWSMARLDAAVTYAQTRGLIPFSVLSNHFSLATMSDPPWEGCLDCADAAFVEWLTVHQLPNFAWSSQARGLFVEERVAPDAGSWAIKENLDRRSRAATLGLKQGVPATAIALAYVLSQPFPSFAMIGSRTPDQIRDAWKAFDVSLSPSDLLWLKTGVRVGEGES